MYCVANVKNIMHKKRKTNINFKAEKENRSNSFNFKLEDESNTITAKARMDIEVRNKGENSIILTPSYENWLINIPNRIKKRCSGSLNFFENIIIIIPAKRIIPMLVKTNSVSAISYLFLFI